jgi:hypothetical protein
MPVVTARALRLCLLAALAASLVAPGAEAAGTRERVLCARDEAGALRVLVLMPPGSWPAGGFRISAGGKALARLGRDESAMAELPQQDRRALERLPARARATRVTGAEVVIYGRLLSDWRFARAAGMGGAFAGMPHGSDSILVSPLDEQGRPAARGDSCRLGPAAPPAAPGGLRAQSTDDGVALYWQALGRRPLPVLSYRVTRDSGAGVEALTLQAPFLPFGHAAKQAAYVDPQPPLEHDVTYAVRWVDALGREGPWARVRVYAMDRAALRPPAKVTAKVDAGGVALSWPASDNPHTAGYVVERAYLNSGPYEVLTPKGIPARPAAYRDRQLKGGTLYFYRVLAMGPRGDLGAPSDPVSALARGANAPPAPRGLKAEVGRTRVRLKWEPLPGNIAGYIVERRAEGGPRWSRLNATLREPPRFDDLLGQQMGGTLEYRVSAVSQDNQESEPSDAVRVRLVDTTPPLPPRIESADGSGGKVTLELRAAAPASDTARIYVLRGGSAGDPGLVIGKPLPGGASKFEDSWVEPGKAYWYHLVAYDAAGNRSADGQAVEVRVTAPTLPRPAMPEARYVSKPLPMVEVRYAPPPGQLEVLVQSSADRVHWRTVAGPTTERVARDLDAGTGELHYRIRYAAADGSLGPPSPAVTVRRP